MVNEFTIEVRAVYDTHLEVSKAEYDRAEKEYIENHPNGEKMRYNIKPSREDVLEWLVWDRLDEITQESPELEVNEY